MIGPSSHFTSRSIQAFMTTHAILPFGMPILEWAALPGGMTPDAVFLKNPLVRHRRRYDRIAVPRRRQERYARYDEYDRPGKEPIALTQRDHNKSSGRF